MHPKKTFIVALELNGVEAGLARYAAKAARWLEADRVAFVHVAADSAGGDRRRVLAELRSRSRAGGAALPRSVKASYDVLSGPLTDRLLEFAAKKRAQALLVGHGRATPGLRALARRLAMKAPCSVWMAPEEAPARLRRILVPIDFSKHSADALRMALALAQREPGAKCLALHVYFNEAVATYEGYERVLRGEEEAEYERFMTSIDRRGVEVEPLFEEGANVAHAIGRAARSVKADLVVMATRGRSRSSAILLGSVTEETIIETRVPLLAVKHFGARLGVLEALLDRRFLKQGELRAA
jgi:nucleotide-binding universal stress UspA family protein